MENLNLLDNLIFMAAQNQVVNPGDYIGEDGLLYCGVCGQKKETYKTLAVGDAEKKIKVTCICPCREREMSERKKRMEMEDRMQEIRKLKRWSLMDRRFSEITFANCESNRFNRDNLSLCKRYASMFPKYAEKNQGLLFWGDVGTGKSYMAACIANHLIANLTPVVMTSFVKLLEFYQSREYSETEINGMIRSADLLILDDLGAERQRSDFSREKVYNIVDGRYRSGKPMIVTTNLTLREMQEEKDNDFKRVYDRIFETCYPMQFTGPSWRKKTAGDRFVEMGRFLREEE